LRENAFDQKSIFANPIPNPMSNPNLNPNPNSNPNHNSEAQQRFQIDE